MHFHEGFFCDKTNCKIIQQETFLFSRALKLNSMPLRVAKVLFTNLNSSTTFKQVCLIFIFEIPNLLFFVKLSLKTNPNFRFKKGVKIATIHVSYYLGCLFKDASYSQKFY